MDDKDWRIIKTIAEERNITKAAARLYISQPALTYRLKNIEELFGTQLVSRSANGVMLTAQGEVMLAYAEEMIARFRDTKEYIQNMSNKVQGSLRIGTSAIFAHYALPSILKGFLDLYPDVEISLKTGLSKQVGQMLEKQDISVAIVRGDYPWADEKYLLSEEPICVVSHKEIDLQDLPKMPHIRYGTDSSLQKVVDEWWRRFFTTPPHTTMDVDTMDTARQMVIYGLGWSILPGIGLKNSESLYAKELSWKDGTLLSRNTWMLCSKPSLDLLTVRAFVDYVKNFMKI